MAIDLIALALAKQYTDKLVKEVAAIGGKFVSYDKKQTLTDEQKARARDNIDAIDESDLRIIPIDRIVDYNGVQELSYIENSPHGGRFCTRRIYLDSTYINSGNYIFVAPVPDDCVVQTINFYFKSSNGTEKIVRVAIAVKHALYYKIALDAKNKLITIYEILSNGENHITYDDNGDFVSNESVSNITTKNLVSKLNSLLKEEDALALVTEMELVDPVAAEDGSIYIDENGALYSL